MAGTICYHRMKQIDTFTIGHVTRICLECGTINYQTHKLHLQLPSPYTTAFIEAGAEELRNELTVRGRL